ncbi:MAG: biotin-dependent carboxyltransferase [Cyclobacteriaceae bacterium]|nr:biotin-dependent carboxyltransferase [Cyclobacteriaceae bacterium HetDA_MAG_MS6]
MKDLTKTGAEVIKPGFLTTIQDMGRMRYLANAVPISGVMDRRSATLANWLVGNSPNQAVLEVTMHGLHLRFNANTRVGLSGADLSPSINGRLVDQSRSIEIKPGDRLEFNRTKSGMRSYLAVPDGWQVAEVLDSKSTYLPGKFGGFYGRPLQKGDFMVMPSYKTNASSTRSVSNVFNRYYPRQMTLRVVKGPEFSQLATTSQDLITQSNFVVTSESNRMGYRLKGPQLKAKVSKIEPSAMIRGTVQLPPLGNPIVLLADAQTTGGYPRVLNVISPDIDNLVQIPPGGKVRFQLIDQESARELVFAYENQLKSLR